MHRSLPILLVLVAACGAPSAPPAASSAPGIVSLRAEPGSGGGHALVVDNGASTALRVHRDIVVERETASGWEHVEASMLYLRERCDSAGGGLVEPPDCVEIPAGTTFRASPWTDMIGDAQCACEECAPVGAGHYRFALTPCENGARLETAPFTIE